MSEINNISFIIPAYNCEETISETIKSIFKDNFTEGDEIIVVDDASTDNTSKTIQRLQKEHSGIRLYKHNYNKGTAAAGRNTGIDKSQNDLIFCLDADNILYPNSISKLKKFLLSNNADAAAFRELHYFSKKVENITHKWTYYPEINFEMCINESQQTPGPSGNYLFTKESWLKAGRYFEPTLENQTIDSWGFLIRQLATGAKVVTLKDSAYLHRYGHDSHFVRESKRGNVSLAALIILVPFLSNLQDSSVEYIMNQGRYSWYKNVEKKPIKIKQNNTNVKSKNVQERSKYQGVLKRLQKILSKWN